MTDEQINQAIAEACGIVGKDEYRPLYQTPDGWVVDCLQFATDLNAMHEAEKVLRDKELLFEYAMHISNSHHYEYLLRATASERAEAFLRTLGKWEEGE
jgi:hypothetical protein